MLPNAQPPAIIPAILRITIISRIIYANLTFRSTPKPSESAAHLIFYANAQAITFGSTARCKRILHANKAFLALEVIWSSAATHSVGS